MKPPEPMKTFEYIQTAFFVLTAFSTLCGFIYFQVFKNELTFEKLKEHLIENKPLEFYHDIVRDFLKKTERFFRKQWSFKSFDKILLIALVYPIIFFFLSYVISGNNMIGTLEIIEAQKDIFIRVGKVGLLFLLYSIAILVVLRLDKIINYIQKKIRLKGEIYRNIISFIVTVGGTIVTVLGVFGVAIVTFGVVGGGILGVVVGSVVCGSIVGGGGGGVLGVLGVGVGVGVGVLGVGVLGVGVLGVGGFVSDEFFPFYMFFLMVLPIGNSIFDFISFEISRFFTKKSLTFTNKFKVSGILLGDLVLATVLLLGTALVIPFFVEAFNSFLIPHIESAEPIDWKSLALQAKDYPFSKGLSVTLMLFSTLVWTAIHAIVAFCSLVLAPIGHKWMYSYLNKADITNIELGIGAFWLTSNVFISIVCLFVIPWFFISYLWQVPIAELLYDFVMKYHFSF